MTVYQLQTIFLSVNWVRKNLFSLVNQVAKRHRVLNSIFEKITGAILIQFK